MVGLPESLCTYFKVVVNVPFYAWLRARVRRDAWPLAGCLWSRWLRSCKLVRVSVPLAVFGTRMLNRYATEVVQWHAGDVCRQAGACAALVSLARDALPNVGVDCQEVLEQAVTPL